MILINLQWLAYPCWIFAILLFLYGLSCIVESLDQPDIGPMLGTMAAFTSWFIAVGASGLGFLIWKAFA